MAALGLAGCGPGGPRVPDGGGPSGRACASSESCREGMYCTTEDGVCNRPPGCRPGAVCPAVCYGTCERRPTPEPGACRVDADCRTFSEYCTGCDCRALSRTDPDPVCPGPGVRCLVDPCMDQRAVCRAGRCALASAPPTPVACASSSSCTAGQYCTTEDGVCNRPPGCGPDDICPAVCYGTCQPRTVGGGERCGSRTCAPGLTCCNASCGICTPPGTACTQQACVEEI